MASRIDGEITQPEPYFEAELELKLHGEGTITAQRASIRGGSTSITSMPGYKVDSVVLDPGYRVLRWTPKNRADAEARASYTRWNFERRLVIVAKRSRGFGLRSKRAPFSRRTW